MYGITNIKNLEKKIEQNAKSATNANNGNTAWEEIFILGILQTMNKIELINGVAIEAGISKAQAKAAVDAAIKVMTTALVKGDKIALVGFGTLAVQEKAERKGVNPSTGAPITIPAKKVVKFKPSAELAEKVKQ